jgi:hypothetical protein
MPKRPYFSSVHPLFLNNPSTDTGYTQFILLAHVCQGKYDIGTEKGGNDKGKTEERPWLRDKFGCAHLRHKQDSVKPRKKVSFSQTEEDFGIFLIPGKIFIKIWHVGDGIYMAGYVCR